MLWRLKPKLRLVESRQVLTCFDINEDEIKQNGKSATQDAKKICAVYSENAVVERNAQKWFARIKAGDFSLEDQERPSRPATSNEDQIKTLIKNSPYYMTRELVEMLKISKSPVSEHFVKLGYTNRFDIWVPQNLTEKKTDGSHFHSRLVLQTQREYTIFETSNDGIMIREKVQTNFSHPKRKSLSKGQAPSLRRHQTIFVVKETVLGSTDCDNGLSRLDDLMKVFLRSRKYETFSSSTKISCELQLPHHVLFINVLFSFYFHVIYCWSTL
ncbi:HTH_48 domain-containing protein [Caerostris extrusa]|uniref:HTH_48 domain-containing protein n=1 Tax=Caerostris extrusa TaxID=172846 RepID=A0AAV4R563_CAEEX|nr:HTH_48 domain-containing protein [Caerostris extrusa]